MDVLKRTFASEGIQGFYRGLTPNILRVLPGTCITFAVYESLSGLMRDHALDNTNR
jgi:solute carrier family 25 folate transporter 32